MKKVNKPRKPIIFYYIIAMAVLLIINSLLLPRLGETHIKEVDYGTFLDMIEAREVNEVQIDSNQILFSDNVIPTNYYRTGILEDPGLVERLHAAGAHFGSEIVEQMSPLLSFLLTCVLPIAVFILIGRFISKKMIDQVGGMGAMSFGKSNAKIYVESETGVKFSDVAGADEAKASLREIVDFLHNPKKYTDIGATLPKGVLLVGPPGTGKTLIARAVAGEAGVPFFSISGSEFVEMFVGMGAAKVRDLFKQAEEKAPCIVFIDEIDTIGKKRDSIGLTGNDEREQTLNQLLTEMDGFDGRKGVIILAATNRPETLDPALLRPGRFDRRIPVELPDQAGRVAILKVHAKKIKLSADVDFEAIARMAVGTSGADLANIINEAALSAIRHNRTAVIQKDLEDSIEIVIAGYEKKNQVLSEKEKLIVAYHEIGHALVAAKQSNTAPVHKITIIPRTSGALGFTMQVYEKDKYLMSKDELMDQICTLTAGRAAEAVVFDTVTTGAANDIEKATKLARAMITKYGMSEFGMVALETAAKQYLGGEAALACSSETSAQIDRMIIELVNKQYDRAVKLIEDNLFKLHECAKFLYEKESINGEQFMKILNGPAGELPAPAESAAADDKESTEESD
ncbi:MAG: ATP-dependent zinc metalloprotease FtsH [Clostridiales bacterium]|nr:ATP-dependent zinc metalloprotease FtsH [Clostridiales bacterium]